MLFKLAIKNIRKSVKDYSIYFFTLVIGVIIFYIFNALDSQTAMLNVSQSTKAILVLMNTFLSGVSVFVAIVLGAQTDIFERAFNTTLENDEAYLPGVVSRKKQILPPLQNNA